MPPQTPAGPPVLPPVSDTEAVRRAGLQLVLGAVFFGLMAVGAKAVAQTLPGPQVALLRMLFGLLVFAAVACHSPQVLRSSRPKWLAARGLFGGLSVLLYFVSIEKVGVGLATVIHYSAPVWAAMLGWLVLKERLKTATVVAMLVALAGVCLVMAPTLLRAWRGGGVGSVSTLWYFVSLASAVVSAAALVSIRAGRRAYLGVSGKGAPPDGAWTLFGGFSFFGALAAAPFALPPLGRWVWPASTAWLLLLGVCVVSVLAQLIMTRALAHVSAAAPGVANQLAVAIAAVGGIVFFNERLSWVSGFGAVLVVMGVVLNLRAPPPAS